MMRILFSLKLDPDFHFYYIIHSGIFFVLPCIENYSKVDLRTAVIDIPPQEVETSKNHRYHYYLLL